MADAYDTFVSIFNLPANRTPTAHNTTAVPSKYYFTYLEYIFYILANLLTSNQIFNILNIWPPIFSAAPYVLVSDGEKCLAGSNWVTTLPECSAAAAYLGLPDTTAVNDSQTSKTDYPPYCYFATEVREDGSGEDGFLKFNFNELSTGRCSLANKCLCELGIYATQPDSLAHYIYLGREHCICNNNNVIYRNCRICAAVVLFSFNRLSRHCPWHNVGLTQG